MKAIKILKRIQNAYDLVGVELNNVEDAIKEVEDLIQENKSLKKTLEMYNEEMISLRIEKQELLNTIIEAQKVIKNVLEKDNGTVC